MATVSTYEFQGQVSEEYLAGMLAFMMDTFDTKHMLNIEVSMHHEQKLIPKELGKSFNSKDNIPVIKNFILSLQKVKDIPCVEVSSIFQGKVLPEPRMYFIIEQEDFMSGYSNMLSISAKFVIDAKKSQEKDVPVDNVNTKDDPEYKSDWLADESYLCKCKLIAKPGEQIKGKIRNLSPIYYVWDLPKDNACQEQIVVNLISLFLKVCSSEEHEALMNEDKYLRFMLFQDTPDGYPYVCSYIKKIETCTYKSHRLTLMAAREPRQLGLQDSKPERRLPCEINYSTSGFFYEFPLEDWKNKKITDLGSFA